MHDDAVKIFSMETVGARGTRVERNRVMTFHTHSHVYFEMLLYQPFDGFLTINGQVVRVDRPTAVLITPDDFHSTQVYSAGEYIKLCCRSDRLAAEQIDYFPAVLTDDGNGLISRLFEAAYAHRDDDTYVIAIMRLAALEIITAGVRLASPMGRPSTSLVSRVMGIINQEFYTDLQLSAVATRLHVTPQHLSAVFSKTAGVTFREYLKNKRLHYAASLLNEGGRSITEVCYASGYRNFSHFVRSFGKKFGVSPSAYMKSNRK